MEGNWQDDYLPPNIKRKKLSFHNWRRSVSNIFEITFHAFSPHEFPSSAKLNLPNINGKDVEKVYSFCKDLYSSSNERIDKLEDKSIKLLTFMTIIFALISFIYLNISSPFAKYILIFSIIFLVTSITVTFRCVNIKTRQVLFITSVYDFESNKPRNRFNLETVSKDMLKAAVFNQNVADNTADILKASRYLLMLTILLVGLSVMISIPSFLNEHEKNEENNSTISNLENSMEILKDSIILNSGLIKENQQYKIDINEMKSELGKYDIEYNKLRREVTELRMKYSDIK